MPVSAPIEIRLGDGGSIDDLVSLRDSLRAEDGLRGVEVVTDGATSESLGALTETLSVVLAPGGAAAVLSSVLITWIRQRRTKVSVHIKKPNGTEIKLNADRIKLADAHDLGQLAADVAGQVEEK